jgi:predicted RNase H-like HicB family nuclease
MAIITSGELITKVGKGSAKPLRLSIERDEDGWWVATVRGVEGVHTQGRTIASARERIVEAMKAADFTDFTLSEHIGMPDKVRKKVDAARAARAQAEKAQASAQATLRTAIRVLKKEFGVSLRDAAELLGISHQRAHQVLTATPSRATSVISGKPGQTREGAEHRVRHL